MADRLGADASVREETSDLDGEADAEVDLFAPRPGGASTGGASASEAPSGEASDNGATSSESTSTTSTPATSTPVRSSLADHRAESGRSAAVSSAAVGAATPGPTAGDTHALADDGGLAGLKARLGIRTRGQIRARKVQRIVRRVDPWSVLKVSLLFYFCVWLMVIVALVLIWGTAMSSGTVGSLESFIAEFLAFEQFKFNGDQLFQIVALGGLIGVFVATAATAVLAVLFNLIADLTGGIRFTVVEEESARRIVNPR